MFLNQSEASIRYTQGKLVVREAEEFRTFLLHFIYHHNSYLFSGIPQIYVRDREGGGAGRAAAPPLLLRSAACFVLLAPAGFFISFIRRNEENY